VKIETYLLLALLIFGVWKTQKSVQRSKTAQERFFTLRASIFAWFVGFILLAAFLFLPNKARVLLLVPVVFGAISMAKFLRDARTRLRRTDQERVNLERMKRVN
jgi:hypothetical protein